MMTIDEFKLMDTKTINDYPCGSKFSILDETKKEVIVFTKEEAPRYQKIYAHCKVFHEQEIRSFNIRRFVEQYLRNVVRFHEAYDNWDKEVLKDLDESGYLDKCQKIIDKYPSYFRQEVLWSNNTKCNTTSSSNTRSSTR